jgi:hypothetical protein
MAKIASISTDLLETADDRIQNFEKENPYNFKFGDWLRLDSYNNPNNIKLDEVVGTEIISFIKKFFPDDEMFGWSISHLPAKTEIVEHTDRMLFHRIAKRIIIITNPVTDVLNWHVHKDANIIIPYIFEYGNIYRLNTAYSHGVKNNSDHNRRGFYIDMMPKRLYEKFNKHPDILTVILDNATGVKHVFP